MGTKKIVLIVAASVAAAICLLLPVSLQVTLKNKTYEYESLSKEDISVREKSLVGIGFQLQDFEFTKQTTDASNDIYVKWLYLNQKVHISNIRVKDVESRYTGTVYEGDAFDSSKVETVLAYENGYEQPINDALYDAPDTIGTDTYVAVHTSYGDAVMSFQLVKIKEISASYGGEIKEGDPLDTGQIAVKKVYEDGKEETITDFQCADTDLYANTGVASGIWTAYGRTDLVLSPIAITGARMEGTFYEGDTLTEGNIILQYADGTENAVAYSDVELDTSTPLTKGINEIPFTYHGTQHTLYISAQEKSAALIAADENKTELKRSYKSLTTSSVYAAVTDHGNYMLAHVVINKPSQFTDLPTQAVVSIGGGTVTTDDLNSQAATAVTAGREICVTSEGTFFSPGKGYNIRSLSASGVIFISDTASPLLIQDGSLFNEGDTEGMGGILCNAVGMVSPGEYYLLTTTDTMTYASLQSIFASLGCTYARALSGTPSMTLQGVSVAGSYQSGNVIGFSGGS